MDVFSGKARYRVYQKVLLSTLLVLTLLLLYDNHFYYPDQAASSSSSVITQQWLNQMLVQWKPSVNSSLNFQVLFQRASYGNLQTSYNTLEVQQSDLNMIISTGANCVRIDLGYAPWLQNNQAAINKISSLIQTIKSEGKCLVIADSASETYRSGGQIPWSQFKQAWVQRDQTLASLFRPDYFIVIKEPGWYVPMISDANTNPAVQSANEWLNLTQTLASTVLTASPSTIVGLSVAADSVSSNPTLYVPYLNGVSKISNISFVGYDIYTMTGFDATQNYLNQYGNGSKSVWIAEAWTADNSGIYNSSRAQLDQEWIQVLYYFAIHIHATAIMPFFTDLFASYSLLPTSPTNSSQILSLFDQRTPVFNEYQNIISSAYATNSQSNTTSRTSSTSTIISSSTPKSTSTSESTKSSTSQNAVTSTSSTTILTNTHSSIVPNPSATSSSSTTTSSSSTTTSSSSTTTHSSSGSQIPASSSTETASPLTSKGGDHLSEIALVVAIVVAVVLLSVFIVRRNRKN